MISLVGQSYRQRPDLHAIGGILFPVIAHSGAPVTAEKEHLCAAWLVKIAFPLKSRKRL